MTQKLKTDGMLVHTELIAAPAVNTSRVVVPVVVVNVVVVVPVDGNVVDVVVVANALIGASKVTTSTAARRTTSRCETLVRLCDTNPPPIGEVAPNIDLRVLRIPADVDVDVGTARLPFASVIVRRRLTS